MLVAGLAMWLALPAGAAGGDVLDALFWSDLDPPPGSLELPGPAEVPPAPQLTADVARRLLERARLVFSGMVYGHRFRYVPADSRRQVTELFQLEPIAEVPWGQQRLTVVNAYADGDRFVSRLRLRLEFAERAHRDAWRSNRVPASTATGVGNRFLGEEGRRVALQDAIKNAIREQLRTTMTKPREIVGEVLIWEAPTTTSDAGRFHTTATVKVIVDSVVPYRVY
jgi:hypothetical protein